MEALIFFALLSSPDWHVRQAADLTKAQPASLAVLASLPDLEVRSKAVNEIERRRDWLRVRLDDVDSLPWISALPVDWPDRSNIMRTYNSGARGGTAWDCVGEWKSERIATKLYLQTLPPKDALRLLGKMPVGMWWGGPWKYLDNESGDASEEPACWITYIYALNEWGDPELKQVLVPKECWPK